MLFLSSAHKQNIQKKQTKKPQTCLFQNILLSIILIFYGEKPNEKPKVEQEWSKHNLRNKPTKVLD